MGREVLDRAGGAGLLSGAAVQRGEGLFAPPPSSGDASVGRLGSGGVVGAENRSECMMETECWQKRP